MGSPAKTVYQFGRFRLETAEHRLLGDKACLEIPHKAFEVLLVLLENRGRLVLKEELLNRVWSDTFVEEANLTVAISQLRKALGDSQHGKHQYIETVRSIGYRFVAAVQVIGAEDESAVRVESAHRSARPWLAAAIMVVLLVSLGAYLLTRHRNAAALSGRGMQAIAVLPLENLSHDPEQEFFADGMTDELITSLARISSLKVISRTSVMRYKKSHKPLSEIARELGIDAVVEGTVLRAGDRVRINAQLIHVPTDKHLWAASYERDLRDVLGLQNEVAQAIAREVQGNISLAERQRLASSHPVDPRAYEAYLKGRYQWNKRTSEGFQQAADLFNEAIRIDPDFAPAYVGLADTYAIWYYSPLPAAERLSRSHDAVTHALSLDESLAEAHNSRAYLLHRFEWNWAGAEGEFKRALQLNSGYTTAHQWYALFLASMGRFDEAVGEAQLARDLDPLSPAAHATLGRAYYFARRFPKAIQKFQTALELEQNFSTARLDLARVYAITGKADEAVAEVQKVIAQNGTNASFLAELSYAYAKAGRITEARAAFSQVQKRPPREHIAPATMAWLFVGLGKYDRAIEWLDKEYDERGNYLPFINTDPSLDALRPHPHFQELLARLRFPSSAAISAGRH